MFFVKTSKVAEDTLFIIVNSRREDKPVLIFLVSDCSSFCATRAGVCGREWAGMRCAVWTPLWRSHCTLTPALSSYPAPVLSQPISSRNPCPLSANATTLQTRRSHFNQNNKSAEAFKISLEFITLTDCSILSIFELNEQNDLFRKYIFFSPQLT